MSCRKALAALDRQGVVALPRGAIPPALAGGKRRKQEAPAVAQIHGALEELGAIEIVPVSSRWSKASAIWKGLMNEHHYLGEGRLCGDQLRYLIRSSTQGLLGGLSFSAASPRLKERDRWIGWSERARRENLSKVVSNSRFVIVSSVEVANLASHALSVVLGRLGSDWRQRYGYEPVLVETFVDGERFAGTCYRAANWQWVGQTAGGTRSFANGAKTSGKKEIFVYPLVADWKRQLCEEPADPLVPRAPEGRGWVEEEFAGARLYDGMLRRRLYALAEGFFAQPLAQIPQACGGSAADTRAAYRFLKNKRVDMQSLLKGHIEATAHRVAQHPVVLAVQDTTSVNHSSHSQTEGLGPINTGKDGGRGLIVHDTVAFTVQGTPLGVVDVQVWAREKVDPAKTEQRRERPIEEKESMKWLRSYQAATELQRLSPGTTVVSCGDREADIHELFALARQTAGGAQLLVRSEKSRKRLVQKEEASNEWELLWNRLAREPSAGALEIVVPRKSGRAKRDARLEIHFAPVVLKPPKDKEAAPVAAWAVYAKENDASGTLKEPIEWMLLTTLEVRSFEEAVERVRWYAQRWGIEVFHRILKSGCRIEDHRLEAADRLETCLALDMVVAWRIFWLTKQGRETPDVPCDLILEELEWKTLSAVVQKKPARSPPTLREAIRMIAKLGGFLGRKHDGEPGAETIWRGLTRLEGMVIGYTNAIEYLEAHGETSAVRLLRARDGPDDAS
jgi:hypothetical protein